jgi:hypothetical protein
MLAIFTAFWLWLPEFSGIHMIHTDNTAVYHGLNKRSMPGPAMEPLREITLLLPLDMTSHSPRIGYSGPPQTTCLPTFSLLAAPRHHICRALDTPGATADNLLADILSRRQFGKIAELCPLLSGPQPKK